MKSRLSAVAVLLLLLFHPWPAAAQELSGKEVKKVLRQADKAYAAGEGVRAADLYGQVLASTPAGDSRRGDALYAVAMALLSPDGPARDVEKAKGYLAELASSFPRHPRRLELSAVRALFAELGAARVAVSRRDAEVEEKLAALEAERQAITAKREELAGESEAAGGRVKSLQAQLRKMRAELAETQSELEKKEESLQKLRDALVSRAGGS